MPICKWPTTITRPSVTVAGRFLAASEKAISTLRDHPFICRARRNGWRQMPIQGHPTFSIFYRELSKAWLLAAVLPTVQDPDAIQARLLIREVQQEADDPGAAPLD